MNRSVLLAVLLFIACHLKAQNLVPNPSFESYTNCPTSVAQVATLLDWFDAPNHNGSADVFNTCASSTIISVPSNYWGSQQPATGDGYLGLNLFYYNLADFREYVGVQLTAPLTSGTSYTVSFDYSLADNSSYSTDDFGIYFSTTPLMGASSFAPINVTPQLTMPGLLSNKTGWTTISLSYTATGGEEYMTFGNFLDDAASTAISLGSLGHNGAYLYIDDFSVVIDSCNLNLGNDTTLCQGETLTLDATQPNSTYLWQDNSTNPTFNATQGGVYWVQVTNSNCTLSDTVLVNYAPFPTVDLGNDTTVCTGVSLLLDATTPNATYLWHDNSTNPTFNLTQQGIHWVAVTVNHCTTTDSILVNFSASLPIELGNDTVLCQGETITLDASISNATYLWQDNSVDSTFSVSQAGTYWVGVNTNNCFGSDTIVVTYNPLPAINLGNDTVLCQGETILLDAITPNATYLWHDNSSNATFNVVQPNTYWVAVTVNNCSSIDSIVVNPSPFQAAILGNDTTICLGETYTLNASTGNGVYFWQDNSSNATFNVSQPGTYWVAVTSSACSTSDTVVVQFEDCEVELEIPNVFSPNNDGFNDLFSPIRIKGITSMHTLVYNRWGNEIFESNELLIQWDGANNTDGTYFWIVNYTDKNGVNGVLTGNVILLH